jgi:hypothetical protein
LVEGEETPSEDLHEDEEEEGEGNGSGEYVDEEEVENAIVNGTPSAAAATMTTPGGGHKTIPWGRKHIDHQPDEEDDELMMYAKVDLFLLALVPCSLSLTLFRFTG